MSVKPSRSGQCPQVLTLVPPSADERISRLAVLDRDGTINEDDGYTYKPEDLSLTPWIVESAHVLTSLGFSLVVASNQAGVARGLFDNSATSRFNCSLARVLAHCNVTLRQFVWCPHGPGNDCRNRKPLPGMIEFLREFWRPQMMVFVGDTDADRAAAAGAGIDYFEAGSSLPDAVRGLAL